MINQVGRLTKLILNQLKLGEDQAKFRTLATNEVDPLPQKMMTRPILAANSLRRWSLRRSLANGVYLDKDT